MVRFIPLTATLILCFWLMSIFKDGSIEMRVTIAILFINFLSFCVEAFWQGS